MLLLQVFCQGNCLPSASSSGINVSSLLWMFFVCLSYEGISKISRVCHLNLLTAIASLIFHYSLEVKENGHHRSALCWCLNLLSAFNFLPRPPTNPFYFQQNSNLKSFWILQDFCFPLPSPRRFWATEYQQKGKDGMRSLWHLSARRSHPGPCCAQTLASSPVKGHRLRSPDTGASDARLA